MRNLPVPANTNGGVIVLFMGRELFPRCVACAEFLDYCPGHPDPAASAIISGHDDGNHELCAPMACESAMLIKLRNGLKQL